MTLASKSCFSFFFQGCTPQKTNMEPENHPFGKEKHLLNHHFSGFHVNFQGCNPPPKRSRIPQPRTTPHRNPPSMAHRHAGWKVSCAGEARRPGQKWIHGSSVRNVRRVREDVPSGSGMDQWLVKWVLTYLYKG